MIDINGVPARIWGRESERAYIYVHGLNGSKDDAEGFAPLAERCGYQVLSVDVRSFDPVRTLPELEGVYSFAASRWENVSLYAVSLGAWFSMVCFRDKPIARTLLVSPVVSMKSLIERMMTAANVTPEQLQEQSTIANLSWEYYSFACVNELTRWSSPISIAYAGRDDIVPRSEVDTFAAKFGASLRVMPDGEHWFHTPAQLHFLRRWEEENLGANT